MSPLIHDKRGFSSIPNKKSISSFNVEQTSHIFINCSVGKTLNVFLQISGFMRSSASLSPENVKSDMTRSVIYKHQLMSKEFWKNKQRRALTQQIRSKTKRQTHDLLNGDIRAPP